MNSTYKKCTRCNSNKVVKNGFQSGKRKVRRYKCKDCDNNFQNKKLSNRKGKSVINDLVSKKNLQRY